MIIYDNYDNNTNFEGAYSRGGIFERGYKREFTVSLRVIRGERRWFTL